VDIWAAGCIFAELLTRRAFLQVNNDILILSMEHFVVHSILFKTKKYFYAQNFMSMTKMICSLILTARVNPICTSIVIFIPGLDYCFDWKNWKTICS
jgi:hypothetical protein